jgi:teichuronic acid biosynthesis glycosyltransferase TuaC
VKSQRTMYSDAKTNVDDSSKNKSYRVLMVTGIYPTESRPDKGTFIKSQVDSLIAAGIEVEIIHPKPGPVAFRYATAITQVFLKTLKGHFDIVHGHYGQWCFTARMQWTTPVVASFLGSDLLGVVTVDGGNSTFGTLVARISRWLCHRVDAVIVKSEGMKKAALGAKNIFIIPNGVDFELFRPIPRAEARAALGWDQDRYYVLFGSDPQRTVKNFPLAQAAIEQLHRRGVSAELVVANGLPQAQIVLYMNASNALILTSFTEGSPNIVKETMACNIPVVSVDVGDVAQVIGRTEGCAVCSHDPEALAAALEQTFRHTKPTTGRSHIQHLDSSIVAGQVIAVYEKILTRKESHVFIAHA